MLDITLTNISRNKQFEAAGYIVVPDIIHDLQLQRTLKLTASIVDATLSTRKMLDMPWCRDLAEQLRIAPNLRSLLPAMSEAVQCTLFVKSVKKNWLVSLHQDLSIPVAERVNSSRCSGWSQKQGDLFVQPPAAVLENIVAVRLHLDACDEGNGALRVVSGSHRLGRLTSAAAMKERDRCGECSVAAPPGGVMVMRPLLLHASSKSINNAPRRVLHFVFGPRDLPDGLRWPVRRRLSRMVHAQLGG